MNKHWDLSVMYTSFDDPKYAADMEAFRAFVTEFCDWAEHNLRTTEDAVTKLETYIHKVNSMDQYTMLMSYAALTASCDAMNEQAGKARDAFVKIQSAMAKPTTLLKQFIGKLDDVDALVASSAILQEHAFFLKEYKDQLAHTMSEAEELLFSQLQSTGSDAFSELVGTLTATLMIDVEKDGVTKKYPLSAVRNMAYESDAALRKRAYEAEIAGYADIEKSVAAALNAIKGEANIQAKARGFDSVLDMTLHSSRMERKTLEAMLSAMKKYMPEIRRFYKHKAKMLGHQNGLPFYDLFAPVGEVEMLFSYDEAADFVVKQFTDYSEKMGTFARTAFDDNWIDPFPYEGKRGGAFCMTVRGIQQSRILSNFDGAYSDVSTLAHELGHAYHNLCLRGETLLNGKYTMPIAETASNFCEQIVQTAAVKVATDAEKLVILENSITDAAQVIVDIYSRFLFEDEVIRRREHGPLSVNELKEIMVWAQKESYGDGLDPDVLHPYMWACKSHYYRGNTNYYNFPYAYGMLFTRGLYAQYLKEGDSFLEKYDNLLAQTGKNTLEDVAKIADIDVTSEAFWASSLDLVVEMVDQFCAY